jgi:hypothetical protein
MTEMKLSSDDDESEDDDEWFVGNKDGDDYITPPQVWDMVKDYIPKDKIIWEPFYYDGFSGECLKRLGFDVIHEKGDFFKHNKGDIVVSNPVSKLIDAEYTSILT